MVQFYTNTPSPQFTVASLLLSIPVAYCRLRRRHPIPGPDASPPPRPSTSSAANPLPFMSFDIPAQSNSTPPIFTGPMGGSGASFEDESPLLEELGINTRQIWRKTLSILHPLRSADSSLHADADLSDPFVFLVSFGVFQLLAGKFHFGIVLGWVNVASLFLYFVFSMLSRGRRGDLDLYRCVSLVGYCMLPMVIFSAVSLFLPRGGGLIFGMAWDSYYGLPGSAPCYYQSLPRAAMSIGDSLPTPAGSSTCSSLCS